MSISASATSVSACAAARTALGSPANVKTLRLWSGSLVWSRRRTPGTAVTAAATFEMTSARRPSLMFGTHSTSAGTVGPCLVASGLCWKDALGAADAACEDREERERELRVALEDPLEVPALDPERGGRLDRAHARGARELVEERHLADDIAGTERRELLLLAVALLDDLDPAGADDERA